MRSPPLTPPLFPYTTLFRSDAARRVGGKEQERGLSPTEVVGVRAHASKQQRRRELVVPKGDRLILQPLERPRSEEHTSELQSPCNLVCRLLLEKKKRNSKLS